MCIPDSRYGLTLAWVTSENSTVLLESDILRLFSLDPILSPRLSVLVLTAPPFFHANFSSAACLSALQPPTASLGLLPPTASAPVQLPTVSLWSSLDCPPWSPAATAFCSALLPPTASAPVQLPTASLWSLPLSGPCLSLGRVVNSHSPPRTTSGTARFHVQESFVWFRAKTDNWIVCFGSLPT